MIVYHGTDSLSAKNIVNNGIDLKYGDESVDNGQGFYTTPGLEFAKQRAKMAAIAAAKFNSGSDVKPVVIKMWLDISDENTENFKVLKFSGCTYNWKQFVFYNRLGKRFLRKWNIKTDNHNLDAKYDIVIDETADAHIADLVSSMRYSSDISNLEYNIEKVNKSQHKYWDKQISLHSIKVTQCIKNMEIMDI